MDFSPTPKVVELQRRVTDFVQTHVIPAEQSFKDEMAKFRAAGNPWQHTQTMETLKEKAKAAGLWNLFLPESKHGFGLTNLEYAPLCEIMGRYPLSAEAMNCSAPDTGNMEVLERYGSEAQKQQWLEPLLAGTIRSAFLMTEPAVASSDAANIETSIRRDGADYVINGRKWWSSGLGDPRCRICIVMGKSDPTAAVHQQQSQILMPADAPGVKIVRMLPVFGFDDAPHGHAEVLLQNVRVPATNMILGEGRGFEIAQGRLGPGRIHHCMRTIGIAERALELLCKRLLSRVAFGKRIIEHSVWEERIADARIDIECARLLTLKAAWMMDVAGNKAARTEIAMIKVKAPVMALKVIDDAIQGFGGAGVTTDPRLAAMYAQVRTLRLADGPDEVHRRDIARREVGKYLPARVPNA
ncbi:MAG: acyl-CoA dehydrogenase family protein [Burkholderiales bacterium]